MIESLAFIQNIGVPGFVIILLVILLLFGGKKLPELARGLGKGLRVFKSELNDVKDSVDTALKEDDEAPRKPAPDKPEEKKQDA